MIETKDILRKPQIYWEMGRRKMAIIRPHRIVIDIDASLEYLF